MLGIFDDVGRLPFSVNHLLFELVKAAAVLLSPGRVSEAPAINHFLRQTAELVLSGIRDRHIVARGSGWKFGNST